MCVLARDIYQHVFVFETKDSIDAQTIVIPIVSVGFWLLKREMLSHRHLFKFFTILWWICCGYVSFGSGNGQFDESIIFPSTFIQRQQSSEIKSFDLLTNNAVNSESVVQLSRSAGAFSLEFFQVICHHV